MEMRTDCIGHLHYVFVLLRAGGNPEVDYQVEIDRGFNTTDGSYAGTNSVG